MRGEVAVRLRWGRGGSALSGEQSGGVEIDEDTDEGPEVTAAVSMLRTRAMGLALETTGERGVLQPWSMSQHSSHTRESTTGEVGES